VFVYNVTIKVENEFLDDWMRWAKEVQIPAILATGCFYDYRFYELMELNEADGQTFVLQFLADSKSDYNRYMQIHHSRLRQHSREKWDDHVVSFRTLLKNVE
jgi:hypothetical protein